MTQNGETWENGKPNCVTRENLKVNLWTSEDKICGNLDQTRDTRSVKRLIRFGQVSICPALDGQTAKPNDCTTH